MRSDLLKTAIIARAKADTGSGGLFETGAQLINSIGYVIENRVSAGFVAPMPYVSFAFPSKENADGYALDIVPTIIQFHVWDTMERQWECERAHAILERLTGNATTQADRLPDWGFHRWQMDLYQGLPPTGSIWKACTMHQLTENESHEDGIWHFIQTYRATFTRVIP